VKNLGWLSLYILLVALGVDGVADEMGIKDARALQCFQIYTVVHAAHLIVALSAGRGLTSWHNAGQAAAFTALCLPWAVWLGLRIAPPQALLIALAASLVAVWLPVLLRRLRDLREFS
jgi:hypothetical protein